MPLTFSTVSCSEVYGTRQESGDINSGYTCSVTLQVSKANLTALLDDIIGNQRTCPWITGPLSPTAKSFGVTPLAVIGVDGQGYDWDVYHVTIGYSNQITTDVVEELEPIAEFRILDYRRFRWSNGVPLTENEAPGWLYQSCNLVRKFSSQPSIPPQLISGIGYVHNAPYVSTTFGLTFPAETLLYCPAPISNATTNYGSSSYNFVVKFSYRPQGWNKYWRPETGTWEQIILPNGSVYKSYPPANLSALLS